MRRPIHLLSQILVIGFGSPVAEPGLGAAEHEISLGGVWVIEAVQQDGREVRDPRWSCMMTFDGEATFSVASSAVTEKWLEGPGGPTTRPVQHDVRFVGTYRVDGDHLVVTLTPPATPEQREFIELNFGPLHGPGTFRTRISWEGQLVLTHDLTGRRLLCVRHTKPVRE